MEDALVYELEFKHQVTMARGEVSYGRGGGMRALRCGCVQRTGNGMEWGE